MSSTGGSKRKKGGKEANADNYFGLTSVADLYGFKDPGKKKNSTSTNRGTAAGPGPSSAAAAKPAPQGPRAAAKGPQGPGPTSLSAIPSSAPAPPAPKSYTGPPLMPQAFAGKLVLVHGGAAAARGPLGTVLRACVDQGATAMHLLDDPPAADTCVAPCWAYHTIYLPVSDLLRYRVFRRTHDQPPPEPPPLPLANHPRPAEASILLVVSRTSFLCTARGPDGNPLADRDKAAILLRWLKVAGYRGAMTDKDVLVVSEHWLAECVRQKALLPLGRSDEVVRLSEAARPLPVPPRPPQPSDQEAVSPLKRPGVEASPRGDSPRKRPRQLDATQRALLGSPLEGMTGGDAGAEGSDGEGEGEGEEDGEKPAEVHQPPSAPRDPQVLLALQAEPETWREPACYDDDGLGFLQLATERFDIAIVPGELELVHRNHWSNAHRRKGPEERSEDAGVGGAEGEDSDEGEEEEGEEGGRGGGAAAAPALICHVCCRHSRTCLVVGLDKLNDVYKGTGTEALQHKTRHLMKTKAKVIGLDRPITKSEIADWKTASAVKKGELLWPKSRGPAPQLPWGMGPKTADKLIELFETGGHTRIDTWQDDPARVARADLQSVFGIGERVAQTMYTRGIDSVARLRELAAGAAPGSGGGPAIKGLGLNLEDRTLTYLRYYDDLSEKIQRDEIVALRAVLRSEVAALLRGWYGEGADRVIRETFVEPLGSYRRGKPSSGDMDCLVAMPEEAMEQLRCGSESRNASAILKGILDRLRSRGLILSDMESEAQSTARWTKNRAPGDYHTPTWLGVVKSPHSGKARRLDIKIYPRRLLAYAVLYFTGSGPFNRALRWWSIKKTRDKAKELAFPLSRDAATCLSLSDQGLHPARRVKTSQGTYEIAKMGPNIHCATERDIFAAIGLGYVPPFLREENWQLMAREYKRGLKHKVAAAAAAAAEQAEQDLSAGGAGSGVDLAAAAAAAAAAAGAADHEFDEVGFRGHSRSEGEEGELEDFEDEGS